MTHEDPLPYLILGGPSDASEIILAFEFYNSLDTDPCLVLS